MNKECVVGPNIRKDGYSWFNKNGETIYGHRASYESAKGKIPKGYHIDHLCRNPSCINPEHLEAVSPKENSRRGLKGILKTHCKNGHLFNHYRIDTNGSRQCVLCCRSRSKTIRDRLKQDPLWVEKERNSAREYRKRVAHTPEYRLRHRLAQRAYLIRKQEKSH